MTMDPYVYPGTDVLRNKFGITDFHKLEAVEAEFVIQRTRESVPTGDFDLKHWRAIHHHLFQDVYDWAGDVRTVEISKMGKRYQFQRFIETGMNDVHARLVKSDYLRGLDRDAFAEAAGTIMGDVNYVHPFREGNTRSQLQYLKQLSAQAGHALQIGNIPHDRWAEAARRGLDTDYSALRIVIRDALEASLARAPDLGIER